MHVRMNMLVGDPGRMDEATRHLEGSIRPQAELLAKLGLAPA